MDDRGVEDRQAPHLRQGGPLPAHVARHLVPRPAHPLGHVGARDEDGRAAVAATAAEAHEGSGVAELRGQRLEGVQLLAAHLVGLAVVELEQGGSPLPGECEAHAVD